MVDIEELASAIGDLVDSLRAAVRERDEEILTLRARLDERRSMTPPAAVVDSAPSAPATVHVEALQLVPKRKRYDKPPKKTLKPCQHDGCTRTFHGTKFKKYCDPCYPLVLRERAAARWGHSKTAQEIDTRIAVSR